MHGYNNFSIDVKQAFKYIIKDYSPKIIEYKDSGFGSYAIEMIFKNCKLLIDLDRMDLQAKFIKTDSSNQEEYHVMKVFEILYPQDNELKQKQISYSSKEEKIKITLEHLASIINEKLRVVLDGDFSWTNEYSRQENKERVLLEKLWSLDIQNPIYKKFQVGDNTWKDDIKNIL